MRGLLGNLLLAVMSTVLFLGLCETVLWVVSPPPKPPFPKNMFVVADGVWTITPGFAGQMDNRIDFRGKRATADAKGRRIVPAAPVNAPNSLFFLGDSQTFGHGVSDEESWPNRLQEALNERNVAAKVENLGVPAINVDQYVLRMRLISPELKRGDMVVVGLSWNDLTTPQEIARPAVQLVDGYIVNANTGASESAKTLIKLYDATGIALPPFQSVKTFLDGLSQTSALVHNLYPRAKTVWYRLRDRRPLDAIVGGNVPEANFFLLSEMKAVAAARGAGFAVVLLPDKMFFEDATYAAYSVNGRDFPEQNYMGYLARPLCAKFSITCWDAFSVLHENWNKPLAYKFDGHYNAEGARVIGRLLADSLYPAAALGPVDKGREP